MTEALQNTQRLPWETEHITALALRQYGQPGETGLADIFRRVAHGVAGARLEGGTWGQTMNSGQLDPAYADVQAFYDLMASGKFSPGGRILAGVGTKHGNVLNCFVQAATANPRESLDGVMELAMKLAKVSKVGGGNGTSLDDFAPRDPALSGVNAPPIGRLMLLLESDHADAEAFFTGTTQDPAWPGNPERVARGYKVAVPVLYADGADSCVITRSADPIFKDRNIASHLPYGDAEYLRVGDSIEDIMESAATMCTELLAGRDVHVDLSGLRAEGSAVSGSGGTSSGPHSFAVEIFDHFAQWCRDGGTKAGAVSTLRYIMASTLRVIVQGGTRRGAGMATINVDHPEVLNFLTAKDRDRQDTEGDISTYNISVKATDAFMDAVKEGRHLEIRHPLTGKGAVLLTVPGKYDANALMHVADATRTGTVLDAAWLLGEIAEHARTAAEPGLLFIDTVNEHSITQERIESTNPCGEIGLLVGEPCDLGALNLGRYVAAGAFDWFAFGRDVKLATRFLDMVLDVNTFALDDNREASHKYRRLGLGIMGLADALILMDMPYDSERARAFATSVARSMAQSSDAESQRLGDEWGAPEGVRKSGYDRRNVATLTVAPTGTTSQIMAASGGIEPLFALKYERRIGGEFVSILEPAVERHLASIGVSPDVLTSGLAGPLASHPDPEVAHMAQLLATANEIPWRAHVLMQGAFQRGMDGHRRIGNAISKTINMPSTTTADDVAGAYRLAWESGCKGVTVYVDGSYQNQVLTATPTEPEVDPEDALPYNTEPTFSARYLNDVITGGELLTAEEVAASVVYTRPERLYGYTDKVTLFDSDGVRSSYLATANFDGPNLRELILVAGKGGSRAHGEAEAIGRLVSLALQSGVSTDQIVASLDGIDAGLSGSYGHRLIRSPATLAARILATAGLPDAQEPREGASEPSEPPVPTPDPAGPDTRPRCAQCGERMYRQEGCWQCTCGNSKCG